MGARSSSVTSPLQDAGHVAAGPNASGARLAPRLLSRQAEVGALSHRRNGGGCLLWAVPYVSTALYRVVVLRGDSVGNRPAAGSRLRGRGAEGRAGPAGRPQKVPRRGTGPEVPRPMRESPGGAVVSSGLAWKFRPRGEDKRNPISL